MSAAPSLTLTIRGASATRMIVVDGPSVTIGRGADCTIVLADTRRAISRLHACIEWRDGHYVLTDSGSNPTLINGHILKVSREAVLRDADALSIGEYLIELGMTDRRRATMRRSLPCCEVCRGACRRPIRRSRRRGTAAMTVRPRCAGAARRPSRPAKHSTT
jgi:pSer/pThr/pTyr-binding forkhead associated (FHA) protein